MPDSFTAEEQLALDRLIKGGMASAKLSVQKMIKSQVTIKSLNYHLGLEDQTVLIADETGSQQLIRAELIGEIGGCVYLILPELVCNEIFANCLPEAALSEASDSSQLMKEGLLSEIGNIMISAMITEFVDYLDVEMYSHVPTTRSANDEIVSNLILSDAKMLNAVIHVNAILKIGDSKHFPSFVLVMDRCFLDTVKSMVSE